MKRKVLTALLLSSTIATSVVTKNTTIVFASSNDNINKSANLERPKNDSTPVINGIKVNKQLTKINYSVGVTTVPKYIVIHDTDNRKFGSNAMANRNYFANHSEARASAHYTVDYNNIIQVLEDTWQGWHVGDGDNPIVNNSNTIGIELCVNPDNNFNKTLENGIALTKYLMQKYSIPASNVIRHYDVSGKICPRMMIKDRPDLWVYFKKAISSSNNNKAADSTAVSNQAKYVVKGQVVNVSTQLNIRSDAKVASSVISKLSPNEKVNIYSDVNGWYKIGFTLWGQQRFGYVSKNFVRVIEGSLNESSSNNHSADVHQSNNAQNNNVQNNSGQTISESQSSYILLSSNKISTGSR